MAFFDFLKDIFSSPLQRKSAPLPRGPVNPRTGQPLPRPVKSPPPAASRPGLPPLSDEASVAAFLGLTPGKLRWLTTGQERHYHPKTIAKRAGGSRLILAPKKTLKEAQRTILRKILDPLPSTEACHGFVKKRGIATNAAPHVGKVVVAHYDLRHFFPTITRGRVYGLFRRTCGYPHPAALTLAKLCTFKCRLPQGAPTSPALANLVCRKLDARLNGLAKKLGGNYTRYADDLSLSGDAKFASSLRIVIPMLRKIVRGEKFRLAPEKSRINRRGAAQIVTGLTVNDRVAVPRRKRRLLRAIVHNCRVKGPEGQNRIKAYNLKATLEGWIGHVKRFHTKEGERLKAEFSEIRWT